MTPSLPALVLLLLVLVGPVLAAEPVKIGALNEDWGPTPATVGLREGRKALGYREGEQFMMGVRFTQGDSKSLPGSDIVFASEPLLKAVQELKAKR